MAARRWWCWFGRFGGEASGLGSFEAVGSDKLCVGAIVRSFLSLARTFTRAKSFWVRRRKAFQLQISTGMNKNQKQHRCAITRKMSNDGDLYQYFQNHPKTGYFHQITEKGLFLLFLAWKSVRRSDCEAFSLLGAYIYTGKEFLGGRLSGFTI